MAHWCPRSGHGAVVKVTPQAKDPSNAPELQCSMKNKIHHCEQDTVFLSRRVSGCLMVLQARQICQREPNKAPSRPQAGNRADLLNGCIIVGKRTKSAIKLRKRKTRLLSPLMLCLLCPLLSVFLQPWNFNWWLLQGLWICLGCHIKFFLVKHPYPVNSPLVCVCTTEGKRLIGNNKATFKSQDEGHIKATCWEAFEEKLKKPQVPDNSYLLEKRTQPAYDQSQDIFFITNWL